MAADGVEAVAEYIKTGKKPHSIDTGEKLVPVFAFEDEGS